MHSLKDLKNKDLFCEKAFLGGEWVEAQDKKTYPLFNPATQEKLGTVPFMGRKETKIAIEKAQKIFPIWKKTPAKERGLFLRKLAELMHKNKEDLALIMTLEQGKPKNESLGEIVYAASFLEWFAEEARRIYGDIIPAPTIDRKIFVSKEPVGICAAITPWNFPSAMLTRKLAPALAAGCPFLIKPAQQTPYSALAIAKLAEQAGILPGLFSVITGEAKEIGLEMTENPMVRKITFTGSTTTGKILMQQSASTLKKISLELGGNAPFIVFEDADLKAAVQGAILSKFRNNGQTCVCANRIYVQESVVQEFTQLLKEKVENFQVGNGTQEGIDLGPLIDEKAVKKVEEQIQDALKKGGKIETGGKRHKLAGCFFEPTIISHAKRDMLVAKEETFGPIAPIFSFQTENEVLEQANDTEYGLASYFYTQNLARAFRMADALEYGMVGVNTGGISTAEAPFGGFKQSGLGREGSKYGMDEYLEIKYIAMAGL